MKHTSTDVDVYPVGLLRDLRLMVGYHRLAGSGRPSQRLVVDRARLIWRTVRTAIARRDWHGLRTYLNGYLAEHGGCRHNAGRGWTKRAALRSVDRLHREASPNSPERAA